MKTVKLILIAAFVSFAMMSFSATINDVDKPNNRIAIEKAMMDRGLLDAMNLQIDESLIAVEHQGFYYAKVRYNGKILIIYGKLKAFQKYFRVRKWVSEKPVSGDKFIH